MTDLALERARQLQARGVPLERIAQELAQLGLEAPDAQEWTGAAVARLLVRGSLATSAERQERERVRPRRRGWS